MIKAGSAKRLIDSLLASVKVVVSDLNGARANFKRLETDRAAAAEKRRREVEAGEEGTPAKKRVLHVKVGMFAFEDGRQDVNPFNETRLHDFRYMATPEAAASL